jgi:hypothetical protein
VEFGDFSEEFLGIIEVVEVVELTTEKIFMTPYIYTYYDLAINPLDPQSYQIRIEDIAHHLALCNRFAGATREPISVAQHLVYASYLCWNKPCSWCGGAAAPVCLCTRCNGTGLILTPDVALQGLLHDASEAYLGDVTKWLKGTPEFAAYRVAEARVQATIYTLFGCALEDAPEVKEVDKLLVRYEMLRGLGSDCQVGDLNPEARAAYPPLTAEEYARVCYAYPGEPWSFWSWQKAERVFLKRFDELTGGR